MIARSLIRIPLFAEHFWLRRGGRQGRRLRGRRRARARASTSSWSAATRSIAPRRPCRNWPRSWRSITASSVRCCSPSTPRTARSTRTSNDNIPGLEALKTADLMIICHALPQPARRTDEAHRRLRRVGQADHRHAHRDACLQPRQQEQDLRASGPGTAARTGRAASAGRCSARRGSTITATTAARARAASSAKERRTIRSSGASRTATSGARPTSTACGCRCPATASRWCWARCSQGMKPTDQPVDGQEERPDDADRLDQDLHAGVHGKTGAGLHHDDGRRRRTSRARASAGCWSTPPTGPSAWKTRSPTRAKVDIVGEFKASPFRRRRLQEGRQAGRLRDEVRTLFTSFMETTHSCRTTWIGGVC